MNKHKYYLKELSKLFTGLIIGDLIALIWLYNSSLLPMNFLGTPFTKPMTVVAIIFDIILTLLLAHYAWKTDIHKHSIHQKTFFLIVGVLLGIVAILHFLRLIFGIDINLGGWNMPIWLSWIGTIVTGYLSYISFHFAYFIKK